MSTPKAEPSQISWDNFDGEATYSNYEKIAKIGEGTYGVVYKAKCNDTGRLVAIKEVKQENLDEGIPQTTIREIAMLKELCHPNIVKLEHTILEEGRICLILEFLSKDLGHYIDDYPGPLTLELMKSFLYQMCQAVCFCHQRRVLHRDLKPQNVLVDAEKNIVKLADFGIARAIGILIKPFTQKVGTLWYRAPEVALAAPRYSTGVDIWSIGCIFAEMATKTKEPLFPGDSEIDQLYTIFKILGTPTEEDWPGISTFEDYKLTFPKWSRIGLRGKLGKYMDADGIELLEKMLIYDTTKRYSAKNILQDAYFSDLDRSKLPAGNFDGSTLEIDTSYKFHDTNDITHNE